eukprot:scaffold3491_cov73-Cylindrotheca_fusiformis.AAC.1
MQVPYENAAPLPEGFLSSFHREFCQETNTSIWRNEKSELEWKVTGYFSRHFYIPEAYSIYHNPVHRQVAGYCNNNQYNYVL